MQVHVRKRFLLRSFGEPNRMKRLSKTEPHYGTATEWYNSTSANLRIPPLQKDHYGRSDCRDANEHRAPSNPKKAHIGHYNGPNRTKAVRSDRLETRLHLGDCIDANRYRR